MRRSRRGRKGPPDASLPRGCQSRARGRRCFSSRPARALTLEGISSHYGIVWYKHGGRLGDGDPTTVDPDLVPQHDEHTTTAVPHRSVRRPLGADRADAVGLARGPSRVGNLANTTRPAGDRQRHPVCQPTGVPWEYLPHDFPPYKLTA